MPVQPCVTPISAVRLCQVWHLPVTSMDLWLSIKVCESLFRANPFCWCTTADSSLNTLPSGDNVRSQPKRKVQACVLQDQGMSESGGGCVAGHCEEPDQVGEMVSCAGVGCSNQVSAIILDTVRVKVLSSMADSFDLCTNFTCQRKEQVLWASM